MPQLKKYRNKEVFIVYNEEDYTEGLLLKMYITSELMELIDHINKLTPSLDFDVKILHGILTSASVLPKNLRGRTAFILAESDNILNRVLISESVAQSDEDLATDIDSLLVHNGFVNALNIENIYILYGYEISIMLSLNEEEIDEEIIDTCQKIVNDVATIKLLTGGIENE